MNQKYNNIDAKQLRLGNFVLVENDYEEVVGINKYEITCRLDETSHGINQSIKDIKPIILTKEWLIRFGFKAISYSMFLPVYNNGEIELANDFSISYNGKRVVIKYVHQLQNLYFFLTDKELVLN